MYWHDLRAFNSYEVSRTVSREPKAERSTWNKTSISWASVRRQGLIRSDDNWTINCIGKSPFPTSRKLIRKMLQQFKKRLKTTYSEKSTGGVNGIDTRATDPDAILFRQLLQVGNIRDSNSGSGFGSDFVNVVVNKPHVVKRRFDFHPHRFLPLIGLFKGKHFHLFVFLGTNWVCVIRPKNVTASLRRWMRWCWPRMFTWQLRPSIFG